MLAPKNIKSIRHTLLVLIVGVIFSFFILFALYLSHLFIKESEKQSQINVHYWAQYIANISSEYLNKDQKSRAELHAQLVQLKPLNLIKLIDIYQYDNETKTEEFYLSYHNQKPFKTEKDYPSIQLSLEERENIKIPHITEHYTEYFIPVEKSGNIIGYIYLQTNTYSGLAQTNQLLIILAIVFVILLSILRYVTSRLEFIITSPLDNITSNIQHIAKSKDYSLRLESMPYQEVDILARSLNIFLTRTEKHHMKLQQSVQQSIERTQELETKIVNRTAALKESNQELLSTLEKLHQFQDQLVESGKMASLGDMVAGVAHEVNTPIGLGVTASTLLSDRLMEMKGHFENKTLKSSQLKRFFNEGAENVGIIYRNLKRAAELISSFKKVAVDQSSEDIREFNMNELISEVLLTLAPQIKNTPYRVDVACPQDLLIWSKPGPINQIFINLILNSILHAFDNRNNGTITIAISLIENNINISFKDDGSGIDETIKNKIFDPFITTKRGSGGSGLGLHLVYNLVTQALGGSITIESELDKGTEFKIIFPLNLDNNYA
ncbi:HAMP domain-containing sensor histidine kinase [Thalassotalea profundi]|uniref:histidine kinase n=1 Tax=Thalassotalea profundi TaxID=2036687 RepID=A0ABQ3ISG0_9GAMM|nr:ATP-binding protein [Thalassotalea profundi]GHE93266.1 hypothetical protein GCM10011501_23300 [Thalassotalea profundi]